MVHKIFNPSYVVDIKMSPLYPSFPIDKDTSFNIDIDGNSSLDVSFRFLSEIAWPPGVNSPNDYLINKKITVEGLDDDFLISCNDDKKFCKKYNLNEKIKRSADFKQSAIVYYEWFNGQMWDTPYKDFLDENYLAFKFKGKYFGWFKIKCFSGQHSFEILEYAYNANKHNSTLTGQIE